MLTDLRLGMESGLDVEDRAPRRPDLPVIIMTAFADLESAVTPCARCRHYISKPLQLAGLKITLKCWRPLGLSAA